MRFSSRPFCDCAANQVFDSNRFQSLNHQLDETVQKHLKNIYGKSEVHSHTEVIAREIGLLL